MFPGPPGLRIPLAPPVTAIMAAATGEPEEYEEITDAYDPDEDELEVKRTWAPPPAWMDFAACAQSDGDMWFPDEGQGQSRESRMAKRVCMTSCPVQQLCLDYAIEHNELYGIWGGLGPDARAAERTKRLSKFTLVA